LAALSTLTGLITQAADSREVYDEIARAATMLLGGRMARVWVDDPTAGLFRIQGTFSVDPVFRQPTTEFSTMGHGRGLLGAAVAARAAEYITDIQEDPRFQNRALARDGDFHAAAVVPLVNGERVAGVLLVFFGRRAPFTAEEKALMQLLANQAAIVLEKSRLYEQAQGALARVEAKNAELDSFVYMVSHDLKAPLVTIQGMASMLALDCAPALDERGRHYLARIEANIEQMEQLISDLLALSRIGREARPAEQVDLNQLVDEVLTTLAEPIRERGVTIDRGDLGSVWAIRTQIQQVFSNLIGNAVKYLGDEPKAHVEIGACRREAWVECYVKDNGIGIDEAYHTKVFELFQRLKEVPVEGSGVGLPIVKKIVEATGGRIWVESLKGQGATFRFTWPATRPPLSAESESGGSASNLRERTP
jgi:signal transduction histidine kinase